MNFNPRSREVSDTAGRWYHFTVGNFNPRSREVSDALSDHMALALLNFNPRSREVSDSFRNLQPVQRVYFNPRSREVSDSMPLRRLPFRTGFQSTLPRGERRYEHGLPNWVGYISIHAPAR